jgi:hypothetical protein
VKHRLLIPVIAAALTLLPALRGNASATTALVEISTDPFTNSTSQHATQVEPDTFAYAGSIVSAFQSGRFFSGGASDIGWATSTDGGTKWKSGSLPGTTTFSTPAGAYDRVSDATVAFDAAHNTWIISFLGVHEYASGEIVDVEASLSTNGGTKWSAPRTVASINGFLDKNWTVCDNSATSPFYGHCYTEFDQAGQKNQILMTTSTDGGRSWGAPVQPGTGNVCCLGGQPVVQPNGTVIVPFEGLGKESAFRSTDGGASWGNDVTISVAHYHLVAGNLRTSPLPSAEIDGNGMVYVVWEDCQFEQSCSANDIVLSTSSDGVKWSSVSRVPTDPIGSGADHFIPGVAVDRTSSGGGARVALTYYYYPNGNCTVSTCQLDIGFISSTNGGASWSTASQLAEPMSLTWLASTSQGYMVGDYISTSFAGGTAHPVIAVANPPNGSTFDEAMYSVAGGLSVTGGSVAPNGTSSTTSATASTTLLTAN